ncbi:ABC transporter permease [Spongorhabdus nitratireducens]
MMMANSRHWLVIFIFTTILFSPLFATLIFSLSTYWALTPLPSDWSYQWYVELATNSRFLHSLLRSCIFALGATIVCCVVTVPVAVIAEIKAPKLKKLMNMLSILPFALPPVVIAVGLLQVYSSGVLILTGTPWILIGAWCILIYPFIYQTISNNLKALNLKDMLEAAQLLGARSKTSFLLITLPNIRTGLTTGILISFSFLLGEFVFASILAGLSYETVQVYIYNIKEFNGHFTSAIVISYILLTFFFSISVTLIKNRSK